MSNPGRVSTVFKPVRMEGEVLRRLIERMDPYIKTVKPRPIQAIQLPYPFVVVQTADDAAIRGEAEAVAGSWLAMSDTGILYPISAEQFALMYEPHQGGS